jgi:hypothetical protein
MIVGPIPTTTIGIDVIIIATTAAMTDAMTTVAMTAMTGLTEVIVVMITMMIVTTTDEMIDVMIDIAKMTTMARTATGRSERLHHHPKGQPQWCIPEGYPRDQLHCQRSPSDQKQPTDSIKRQGDRTRQH